MSLKLGFYEGSPIAPCEPNDEDRHLIQQLVIAHWQGRGPEASTYPIADIVTDAYHETLKLMRKKYGL